MMVKMQGAENVDRGGDFSQVCVWPGTIVGRGKERELEEFMLNEFGTRVQYLEEVKTAPDSRCGYPVEGTGGRNDLFFAVHSEDVGKFAVPRLAAGIRWVEDVLDNEVGRDQDSLYPARIAGYRTW